MDKLNKIIESYPPELKLVLVFCGSKRWRAEDLVGVVDWERFLEWVRRHRVGSVVFARGGWGEIEKGRRGEGARLREGEIAKGRNCEGARLRGGEIENKWELGVPEWVLERLEKMRERVTRRNLLLAAETIRICKLLEDNNIKSVPLKGVFLSKQLYGDYNLRETRDIDVLVEERDLEEAAKKLLVLGYNFEDKKAERTFNEKGKIMAFDYPIVFKNASGKISVELHWQLLPIKCLAIELKNDILLNREKTFKEDSNIYLPRFEDHIKYINLHGLKHLWCDLQWVLDIKEIINILPSNSAIFIEKEFKLTSNFINLLFEKSLDSERFSNKKWITTFLKTFSIFKSSDLKTFSYKIKYLKMLGWISKKKTIVLMMNFLWVKVLKLFLSRY